MEDIELWQGDCLELMKDIPDGSIDCIITDPPYKVTARGNAGNSGGMLQKKINRSGNVFKCNNIKIEEYIDELYRVLKPTGHCYIMTNNVNITHFLSVIDESNFHFIKNLIWVKNNKIMGQCYMNQYEYIIFLRKGKHKRINKCGTSDVMFCDNKKRKGKDGKNLHDTEKPVELITCLIDNSTDEQDTVLDCFMGIGSTGVACVNTNRNFIGIELDEEYYKIAEERIRGVKK